MTTRCESCPQFGQQCEGDGPSQANLVIVGEAPGKQEVVHGKPFIGPSGNLLNMTLKELGMPREEVYVTNAVMCRPVDGNGNDTKPGKAMLSACHNRLVGDVRSRAPRVVLAVGGTAAKALTGATDGISKVQGTMHWNEELQCYVIPTYHPTAVLHGNTGYFDDIYETTKRAIRFAQGVTPLPDKDFKLDWEFVTSRERAREILRTWCLYATRLAFDTESRTKTDQPRPAEDEWILSQFYDGIKAYAIPTSIMPFDTLTTLLLKDDLEWDMHNMAYDRQVLLANGRPVPKLNQDTMCWGLGLTERGEQVGLKALSRTYCNADYYEQELTEHGFTWKQGPRTKQQWLDLGKYGCLDTYYTWQLRDILPPLCEAEGTTELVEGLLHEAALAFTDWESFGAAVDLEYAQSLEDAWSPKIDAAIAQVQEYATKQGFPQNDCAKNQTKPVPCPECIKEYEDAHGKLNCLGEDRLQWRKELAATDFGDPSCRRCMKRRYVLVRDDAINVRSFVQMQHLCYDILRMRHPDRVRSCDEAFWSYNERHPLAQLVAQYRELDHIRSNYIRGIADDVWSDGRVHPDFLLFGTVTGRLSIRNPPMQTIPKWGVNPENAKLVRKMFVGSRMEFA
jgi:uracil-DNA glycosylase family 4